MAKNKFERAFKLKVDLDFLKHIQSQVVQRDDHTYSIEMWGERSSPIQKKLPFFILFSNYYFYKMIIKGVRIPHKEDSLN